MLIVIGLISLLIGISIYLVIRDELTLALLVVGPLIIGVLIAIVMASVNEKGGNQDIGIWGGYVSLLFYWYGALGVGTVVYLIVLVITGRYKKKQ